MDQDDRRAGFPVSARAGIVGIFLILAVGALYYARSFFLPLVLAVLLTLTLAPLVRALGRRGIPSAISAAMAILVLGAGLGAASLLLSEPLSRVLATAPDVISQVRERFAFLRAPFAALNDIGREVEALAAGSTTADAPQPVVLVQPGLLTWLAGAAAGIGTTLGASLILALFLLANRDTLRLKLIRVLPDLSDKKRSLRVLRDIESEVSRYLLAVCAINAGLGLCVGLAMAVLGLHDPVLWGVGAGLLNFVPFVGPLLGECAALAVGVITFPTPLLMVLPPLAYLAIQLVEGNFVTPTILGRRLELNPVAILVALSLTTWMWGIIGTILGVPLLVVVKAFTDNFPSLSSLGEFLSAEPAEESEGDAP